MPVYLNVVKSVRIEAFLMKTQFRWTGHVIRMEDDIIPKRTFYGQMTVYVALADNSSGSRTVSRQISKRATSRLWSSNPWHGTRVIGEPPAAAPSPNSKTTEYAKLPKGQATATQASIDAGCKGGIDSARTISL